MNKGDRVRVTYEGVVRDSFPKMDKGTYIEDNVGNLHFYTGDSSVSIEVLAPEYWPPKLGDIWQAEGHEYYVDILSNNNVIIHKFGLRTDTRTYSYSDYGYVKNTDDFKAMNPVLVRRQGVRKG